MREMNIDSRVKPENDICDSVHFWGALVASYACSPSYFVTRTFFLLTQTNIGALRGVAKSLPRRGGSTQRSAGAGGDLPPPCLLVLIRP